HPLADGSWLGGEQPQRGIDASGRRMQLGIGHHVTAADGVLGDAVAGEIEGAALAADATLGRAVLRMDAADAGGEPRGADDDMVADRNAAAEHRAGDHGAGPGESKRAIDGEAETAARGAEA